MRLGELNVLIVVQEGCTTRRNSGKRYTTYFVLLLEVSFLLELRRYACRPSQAKARKAKQYIYQRILPFRCFYKSLWWVPRGCTTNTAAVKSDGVAHC